ncbi:MAG TPA: hypothetical protein VMI06_13450 [Terriglobia bacterium]|nr:hypothetical protein [Terriglobia bacterium]
MKLDLKTGPARVITVAVSSLVFALLVWWIGKAYLATVIGQKAAVPDLRSASNLDPSDATYALKLGRLYEYSVANAQPEDALHQLRRAVTLNSYNPQAWLDLATALEFQGKTKEAALCLRRVDYLAPDIPSFQWSIGNFFLLHGNTDEAFRHFKIVLEWHMGYDETIYDMAWKSSDDAGKIFQELIPQDAGSELSYLGYLVSTHRLDDADAVWNRLAAGSENFPPGDASSYIDATIGAHHPGQAYKVWTTLREKGLIPPTYESTPENLLENGDFEEQPLGMGFDWRIAAGGGIFVGLDSSVYHSASHSLMVQFPGTENFNYHNVYQFVPVLPDHQYRLFAYMKTDGITTDSGPRMQVWDAYDAAALDKYSNQLLGTSSGWQPLSIDFKTGRKTRLLAVAISRLPSDEFKNKIAGRFWVDDVSLTPEAFPAETTAQ